MTKDTHTDTHEGMRKGLYQDASREGPEGAPRQPRTRTRQGETQHPVPPMPYERDESAPDTQSAQEPSMERVGRLAHADAARGAPDTTRGAELDATYHRLREGGEAAPKDAAGKKVRP